MQNQFAPFTDEAGEIGLARTNPYRDLCKIKLKKKEDFRGSESTRENLLFRYQRNYPSTVLLKFSLWNPGNDRPVDPYQEEGGYHK